MGDGHESEIFERINELDKFAARSDEWRKAFMDRLEKLEEHFEALNAKVDKLREITIRSDVKLGIVLAAITVLVNWIFKH